MSTIIRRLIACGEAAGGIAIFVIAAVILYDIFARAAGHPTLWVLEIASYLMIAASVLAAGAVLQKDGHFDVRLFVDLLPRGISSTIDKIVQIVSALFICAVTVGIVQLTMQTTRLGMRSPTILQVPLIYPQSVLIIGFVLLSLASIVKAVTTFRDKK